MAGSYQHLVREDGSFRMDLIENMGDAYEALEDCFDIIQRFRRAARGVVEYDNPFIGDEVMRALNRELRAVDQIHEHKGERHPAL